MGKALHGNGRPGPGQETPPSSSVYPFFAVQAFGCPLAYLPVVTTPCAGFTMSDLQTPAPAASRAIPPPPPRLLDQLRQTAERHGHPGPMIQRQVEWCRRYILFHAKRHPRELGPAHIGQFLEHLAR